MGDLALDAAVTGGAGRYAARIEPSWRVWGPNGGYLGAIALRAAAAETALVRPASFSAHFLRMAEPGDVDLRTEVLRDSKRATSIRVRMSQDGRAVMEALVWVVAEGDGLAHDHAPMPDVPPPEDVWAWTDQPNGNSDGPGIPLWGNFEARAVGWPAGMRWEERAPGPPLRLEWFRFRPRATFDDPFLDAARALVLIDTFALPAAMMHHLEPLPYLTLDVTAHFHRPAADDEWLLCESVSPVAADGLLGGTARIWSRSGRLVATGAQHMLCRPMGRR